MQTGLHLLPCKCSIAARQEDSQMPVFQDDDFRWLRPCGSKRNSYGLQEGEPLEPLLTAAASCMAEAEAFLQVAEFTIKEARARVLYTQPWPSQQSKAA